MFISNTDFLLLLLGHELTMVWISWCRKNNAANNIFDTVLYTRGFIKKCIWKKKSSHYYKHIMYYPNMLIFKNLLLLSLSLTKKKKQLKFDLRVLTCGVTPDGVRGISLRTTVLPAPSGCDSVFATAWPLPLPPSGIGWVFCPGRIPCVVLATGLMLAAGEVGVVAGRALFVFVLPGATGSSRRLLLRCCICLETGVFWRKGQILCFQTI